MSKESLIECTFYIPTTRDNLLSDGSLHDIVTWEWLQDQIFDNFDGATELPGLFKGFYRDPDTRERVHDRSKGYMVALSKAELPRLRAILRLACQHFQQKAIYLSIAGKVEFIQHATE